MATSSDYEAYSVDRETAAHICGITDAQLKLWFDRNDLFPEKRRGRGYHASYDLPDLMKIAAAAELVNSGLSVNQACDAVRPYSPYGDFVHQADGLFWLSRNSEGRWVGMHGDMFPVSVVLRTRAIFQKIRPLREAVMRADTGIPEGRAEAMISAYQQALEKSGRA